jgi:hypothetical protein
MVSFSRLLADTDLVTLRSDVGSVVISEFLLFDLHVSN